MNEKPLIKNMLWNSIRTIITLGFPLITFMYTARILQTEGLGKLSFSKSYVAYFSMLAMLGISNYSIKEASPLRDDRRKLSNFAHDILVLNFIAMFISYIIFFISLNCIHKLRSYKFLLIIFSITIFFNIIGMDWLYSAIENFQFITIRTFFIQLISFVLVVYFVRTDQDINKYAVIQVFSLCGTSILNFCHARKYIDFFKWEKINIKEHIKPIFVLFGTTLFIQVFTHLDSTMLGFLSDDRAVGLYSAANKMSLLISSIIASITAVMFPRISYYVAKNEMYKIRELIDRGINYIFMLAIPCTVGIIILSSQLISIFSGNSYMDAVNASRIMAVRVMLVPLNNFILIHLLIPLGMENKNLISTGAAAILNFVCNLYLIPRMYQDGAAIATVIAEVVELFFNVYYLSKIINLKYVFNNLNQYFTGAFSLIIIWFLLSKIRMNEYIAMGLFIIISIVFYPAVLFFLKNKFLNELLNMLKNR